MTSHTGRTYLHSCLKVPLDPCNNCPAPIYNRPKIYLGRLSTTTPMSSNVTKLTSTQTKDTTTDLDTIWSSQGVRSLAQFYDSIPDYCDINHLPEEEFYSTLDSLKTTCREFKTKTLQPPCILEERSVSSSTVSTLCTVSSTTKSKKTSKKKTKNGSRKKSNQSKETYSKVCGRSATPCATYNYKNSFIDQMRLKSYKEDFKDELEDLKKTLKEFELRRPTSGKRVQKVPKICTDDKEDRLSEQKNDKFNYITRPTSRTTSRQSHLRKSYSFNDIHSIASSSPIAEDLRSNDLPANRLKHKLTKAEMLAYKDRDKLSNYFLLKTKKDSEKERYSSATTVPKIIVGSPGLSDNFSSDIANKSKHANRSTKQLEIPIEILSSNEKSKQDKRSERLSPSPVHPVARPNLAATLRANVSRKKRIELENNCTYHDDATPTIDWEVRKTPAWKSLALNESHKEIIALRLATRKAEQKLQQREYELNMELMRQRVKSAPLLLEGITYWGFNVGKLTHTCQQASIKHACQHQKQRKQRRKINSERRSFKGEEIPTHRNESLENNKKYHSLKTIYASTTRSCSRNSRRHAIASQLKPPTQPESGDDLSTGDRAYL